MERLLSLRFPRVEGLLGRSHWDLLITSGQSSVCFIRELFKRHPNLRTILDIWLMLLVMQFR